MSWQTAPLSALGSVGRGKSRHRPRNDPSLYGGPYPFFQTGDVTASEFYLSAYSQTYNDKGLAQSKIWEPETLCITIAANIAETAVLKIPGCFPDSIVGFRADHSKSDVKFVKYALDFAKRDFQTISKGTTQDNLSVEKLLSIDLPAPPLETQRRIADILSAYDDLIENNTRRIAILEDMARRLFEEWFIRPIRKLPIPGDRLQEWNLPKGWTFSSLSEVSSITMGQSPPSSEYNVEGAGIPFHQGVTEFTGHFHRTKLFCASPDRYRKAKEGDILFSVRAPVGRIALALHNLVLGRGLSAIRATSINHVYLLVHLKSQFSSTDMFGSGTIYKSITKDDLFGVPILVPDNEALTKFAPIGSDCWASIRSLHQANTNLRTTRDLLLPQLISGEIEVRAAEEALEAAAA